MRGPLLKHHPEARAVTMRDLVGIANAIEQEAVRRYGQLADVMERRGERETAQVFRRMRQEEQNHVATVSEWAASLNEAVPPSESFEWRLPPEIAGSWEAIVGSALLTPYRALAIAVRNEEQAFALYAYLAAEAADPAVAAEAEKLASQELEHAALLRRWRRAAYRKEDAQGRRQPLRISTTDELDALLSQREGAITACHRELADRLRRLGADDSAAVLLRVLDDPTRPPVTPVACPDPDCRHGDPLRLLVAAQKPLERLSEELEYVLESAEGELAAAAEAALMNVIGRLAQLTAQIQHLSETPVQARWPD